MQYLMVMMYRSCRCSYSRILTLNQKNKVIIVDNSSTKKSKKTNYIFKYTDEEIFSNNIYCDSKKTNFLPVASAIEGGFTKIWGGTFSELRDADFKNWDIDRNELNNFFYI